MPTTLRRHIDRSSTRVLTLDPVVELTLTFSPGPDGAFVVTASSSEGEAQGRFRIPWDEARWNLLCRSLGRRRRNTRPSGTEGPEPAWDPWREGRRLHDALFAAPGLRDLLETTRAASPSRPFRLRVVLDPDQAEATALHAIPWELLFRRDRSEVTALTEGTSVVRSLMVRGRPGSFELGRRLRVLMITSGARDLDLETERRRIEQAAGRAARLEVRAERTAGLAPLERLLRAARSEDHPFQALHLAGHGDLHLGSGGGSLRWELPDGSTLELQGRALATLLRTHRSVQLVFLNACHTGEIPGDEGDPFAGVASALLQAGVPAVVAVQGEIGDDAAILFAGAFYSRLADGAPPETAMTEARRALFLNAPNELEWLKPILFLATPRPGIPPRLVRLAARIVAALVVCIVLLLFLARWQHCQSETQALATAVNGAVVLLSQGRAADALAQVDRANEEARCRSVPPPLRAAAHATAGLASQATGDLDGALRRTSRAVRLDPAHAPHHVQLAMLLARSGRAHEGVRVLHGAIELDPASVEAHRALATVYLDLDRPEEARRVLARGFLIRPTDGLLHATMGRAYLQLDRPGDAERAFRRALQHLAREQIDPRADAAFGLVEAALASRATNALCTALSRFHAEDPDGVTEHALDAERLDAEVRCVESVDS